jgi:hypothetical protein
MTAAPLNTHEQELLSALLDDALEGAERKQAEALLLRAEAREYLHELRATRTLIKQHASVRAPVGLGARVMSALEGGFDDVSRPVNNQAAPAAKLHQIGAFSWRAPLFAAAAVFVVSVSVIFGPSLFRSDTKGDTGIAREVLEQGRGASPQPERTGEEFSPEVQSMAPADELRLLERQQPKQPGSNWNAADGAPDSANEKAPEPEPNKESAEYLSRLRENADKDRNAQPDPSDEERKKLGTEGESPKAKKGNENPVGLGGGTGGGGDTGPRTEGKVGAPHGSPRAGGVPAPRPAAVPPAEPTRDENDNPADAGNTPSEGEEGAKESGTKSDDKADLKKPEKSDTGGRLNDAKPGVENDAESTDAQADEARRKARGYGDDSGGSAGGKRADDRADQGGKSTGGASAPGAQPAQAPAVVEALSLELADKDELLAVQSDLLWVAFLHGKADLDEEGNVTIELDGSRRAALLKALHRLNAEQAYGKLSGEAAKVETAESDKAGPAGYLPESTGEPSNNTIRITIALK